MSMGTTSGQDIADRVPANALQSGDTPAATADNRNNLSYPKTKTNHGVVLVCLAIAITAYVYFQWKMSPLLPKAPGPTPTIDYSALIQVHADQASHRNLNALKLFEMDVSRLFREHKPLLTRAAREAAQEAADYGSCSKIVYYLAWDKVKTQNETEAYLNREIRPFVDPAILALSKDVNAAVDKLNYELRRSTVQLAADLAALNTKADAPDFSVDVDEMSRLDIQKSLRNLGFSAAGIGASVTFDAVTIGNRKLVTTLWKKITAIATRLFAKQVTKLGGAAAVAAADGPLPVGDIIALGGIIWTGYDIYTTRQKFETKINTSLDHLLAEAIQSLHQHANEHARTLVRSYQSLQAGIGTQTHVR